MPTPYRYALSRRFALIATRTIALPEAICARTSHCQGMPSRGNFIFTTSPSPLRVAAAFGFGALLILFLLDNLGIDYLERRGELIKAANIKPE